MRLSTNLRFSAPCSPVSRDLEPVVILEPIKLDQSAQQLFDLLDRSHLPFPVVGHGHLRMELDIGKVLLQNKTEGRGLAIIVGNNDLPIAPRNLDGDFHVALDETVEKLVLI